MLDMGFIADIRRVIKLLPQQRQNLMFSATYSDDIRRLAQSLLRQPVEIEVARRNAAVDTVEQQVYMVPKDTKRALLSHLIREGDWSQVLVFTRTKHGANRLTKQLEDDGIAAAAIHGNKSQSARTRALADFKSFNIRALVATEVAARGLDIKELPHVVNYELPNVPEDYVHRIGRTGRAGATGVAISLVGSDETGLLKDIERLVGKRIAQSPLPQISAPPPPTQQNGQARAERDSSLQARQPRGPSRTGQGSRAGQPPRQGTSHGRFHSQGSGNSRGHAGHGNQPGRSDGGAQGRPQDRSHGSQQRNPQRGGRRSWGSGPQR